MAELDFEETYPGHLVAYAPSVGSGGRRVRPVATVERRCGRWIWWMRDESAIGLCDTYGEAMDAVAEAHRTGGRGPFVPPTPEQVRRVAETFCRSRGIDPDAFDVDAFFAHYEANGWTVNKGRRPMSDWRAAARNWIVREAGR